MKSTGIPTDPKPYHWLKDWRVILAFCGVTSLGGAITTGKKVVGFFASDAIHQADSTNKQAMRAMLSEFSELIITQNIKNNQQVIRSIEDVKDVVSRMPGAKAAREQIRRDSINKARVFGWAEIRSRE